MLTSLLMRSGPEKPQEAQIPPARYDLGVGYEHGSVVEELTQVHVNVPDACMVIWQYSWLEALNVTP